MDMTRVPHVGATAYDTHAHLWTVTGWQLTDGMVHIARNTISGTVGDCATATNGVWHVFGEPENVLKFNPSDLSRLSYGTTRPIPIDTGEDARTTRVGAAGRALSRVMQVTGHSIHPNDAGRVLNNMVEAMIAGRTLDTVEKELSTVQTMIKGATILAAVEVLTLWETDLRREYVALKDADELCMTIGCREHSGPENPYCDSHSII